VAVRASMVGPAPGGPPTRPGDQRKGDGVGHALTIRRRALAAALALTLAAGIAVVASHRAGAAGNSVSLSGPASNVMGTNFNYTVSGTASGAANREVSFEQFNKAGGCSSSFAGESAREFLANSTYEITFWASAAARGSFSATDAFGAAHPGVHGVCAYLINASTGATYAHAQAWWTNHS
jgi:hypothetical protein